MTTTVTVTITITSTTSHSASLLMRASALPSAHQSESRPEHYRGSYLRGVARTGGGCGADEEAGNGKAGGRGDWTDAGGNSIRVRQRCVSLTPEYL
jgi:hypothetical protein